MTSLADKRKKPVVLLVSPDASRTGAPLCFGELLNCMVEEDLRFRPVVLVAGKGPLLSKWQSTTLEVVVKEKRRIDSPLLKVIARSAYLLEYVLLLARWRPQLVYSNTIRNSIEVVLARLAGARTLVHVHEGAEMMRRHALSLRVSSWFTSRYICVSEYSAQSLKRYAGRGGVVIFNGIQISADAEDDESRARSGEWVVGMAGDIQPNKGCHIAIEAIAKLSTADCEVPVRLSIYGNVEDANYRQSLDELIKRLGVERNVEFRGSVPTAADIYENVHAVVVASFDESFSRVLIEAFQHQRPVVASAVGGIPEIVRNEENGLLVPPGDAGSLAAALLRLIRDPALVRRLVRTGAVDVRKRFRLEDTLARVRVEIEALLPKPKS